MSADGRYQPHVDGLRAVAVLVVLLFHLELPGFAGGFVGVDVFLVISGFLITRLITEEVARSGSFRFGDFYLRRIRRLAPALVATCVATVVAGALVFTPEMLVRTAKETIAAVLSVSNFRFWDEADYFDVSAISKPLLHTWSLSLEEQFYLLWPAFLVLLARSRLKAHMPAVLGVVAAASLALNPLFADGAPSWLAGALPSAAADGKTTVFFLLPFRVFEFAIGGLLVWMVKWKPQRAWVGDIGLFAGLALIGVSTATFHEEMLFPSFAGLVPCVGAALAIHCGDRSRARGLLENPASVGLGLVSYSLYLVHWPIIVVWRYVDADFGLGDQLWIIALSLALGVASHRFVETPFRRKSISLRSVAVAAPLVLAVSVQIAVSRGWTWRVAPEIPIDLTRDVLQFHREQYGGAGYMDGQIAGEGCPDLILIGDSHGKQYAEGMAVELAPFAGLSVHMQAGESCLHLPGFVRTTKGSDWSEVLSKQLATLGRLVSSCETKPAVVVAHSWIAQMNRSVLIGPDGRPVDRAITTEDVVDGLVRLRNDLGIERLIVLGNVPIPKVRNLFAEVTKPPLSRRFTRAELETFELRADVAAFNAALAAGAARTGAYVFIDPCDVLCQDGGCLAIDPTGELIYSDASHLSKFGSRKTVRSLRERLTEAVGPRP